MPAMLQRCRAYIDAMPRKRSLLLATGLLLLAGVCLGGWQVLRDLPSLAELDDVQPKVALRVYSADDVLIGEFGKERRSLVKLADIPLHLKQAVIAIEDARFYEHGAVDWQGAVRAGIANFTSGGAGQGASTLTMQLARDLFLTRDKTAIRKLREIVVAYKIEAVRSKDEILALYLNQVYLGQRAYGFPSAARIYFGKNLADLTLAESAMLAGLPKAPSAYNPVVNPKRARIRQAYILKRMQALGYINAQQYAAALAEPLTLATGQTATPDPAPFAEYAAEMARQQVVDIFGDSAYSRGLVVKTTLDYTQQRAAWDAVHSALLDYDRKHGYRGPEGNISLPDNPDELTAAVSDALESHPDGENLTAAAVISSTPRSVTAMTRDGDQIVIRDAGLRFAAAGLRADPNSELSIRPGAIIRITKDARGNDEISQTPAVQGALIALSPQDGSIKAMIGGFDFELNHFNRTTQAMRQPGSTFKPFVYSAALEKGVGPATVVNDAPIAFKLDPASEETWQPKDDDAPLGPITLRRGLQKSKNLVAVRVLDYIGVPFARQYVTRFGFDAKQIPPYLPMALGAGQVTPLQLARGYTAFANGGYGVTPYLIASVTDGHGKLLRQARPALAEMNAPRLLAPDNAFVMHSLLVGVAQHGTAYQSNALGRTDIAGKTGTTNDAFDAWFAGYQRSLVAVSWMGFDQPHTLGSNGAGAQLALPIWMKFMATALKNVPIYTMPQPSSVVMINGDLHLSRFLPNAGFVARIGLSGTVVPEAIPTDQVSEDGLDTEPTDQGSEATTAPAVPSTPAVPETK